MTHEKRQQQQGEFFKFIWLYLLNQWADFNKFFTKGVPKNVARVVKISGNSDQ
jgi:hypothetical protein